MPPRTELMSPALERALRWAAVAHRGQVRKGVDTPYFQHLAAVAMILDRLGFDEDVVIAGLLHDVVEDAEVHLREVRERFGRVVAELVAACSEQKTTAEGQKRPWSDRKRDHLEALAGATVEARAVVLADKLHNLLSISCDLSDGRQVWSIFNAGRADVVWYYRTTIERLGTGDPRLESLAGHCARLLAEIEGFAEPPAQGPAGTGLGEPGGPSGLAENRETRPPDR